MDRSNPRRFSIEPARRRYHPQTSKAEVPDLSRMDADKRGIRLFPSDFLHIDRKLRFDRAELQCLLEDACLAFHVVDVGAAERDPYVKIRFETPRGIYVSTFRRGDDIHPATACKFDRDDEETGFYPVKPGQVVVIRPDSDIRECVMDLESCGIQIYGWQDRLHGDMCLKIARSNRWLVDVMEEAAFCGMMGIRAPTPTASGLTIDALRQAIEQRHGAEEYQQIVALAQTLTCAR